jgi:fructose-1,6-bisphosphatase/inositol monophosphatase family enzyme
VTSPHPLLDPLRDLHRSIRDRVHLACQQASPEDLARVAEDAGCDTIYALDEITEAVLIEGLEPVAAQVGGIVLVAEGVAGGLVTLPRGRAADACRYRMLFDPIDGTRGLMYQKRPAWVLTGVAPNRGPETRLLDVELAVQTELPLVKQALGDELWATRGGGAHAERVDLATGSRTPLPLVPSRANSVRHGYAMVSRFFPGLREELAAIDEEIIRGLIGPIPAGKAVCFEDQYASSGGQLYELMIGHDRFVADLRPLLAPLLTARGMPLGLCCHPYDVCTALIAAEAGVVVRDPFGALLDAPFDVDADVAWAGYANPDLCRSIQPLLRQALSRRGIVP